jgi:redox-sensitive bicupin YhaK (pirin superfamily)
MPLTTRPALARGHADHGWLDSRHTFSFADYYDAEHMGFGPLRVINDDRVQPAAGFAEHGHRNMEIVSYVVDGALEHRDSLGKISVIRPGDVQRMTAGTGIRHSEYNPSNTEPVRFLQIWIVPEELGLAPGYEQKTFPAAERAGRLRLVASRDGRDGSLRIHRDVDLYATLLDKNEQASHAVRPGRTAWVQVVKGELTVNDKALQTGDGLAVVAEDRLCFASASHAEALVFDMKP